METSQQHLHGKHPSTTNLVFNVYFVSSVCLLSLLLIEQLVLDFFFDFGYFGHAMPGQNSDSAFSDAASPYQTNASEGGSSGSQAGRPNNGVVHKVVTP